MAGTFASFEMSWIIVWSLLETGCDLWSDIGWFRCVWGSCVKGNILDLMKCQFNYFIWHLHMLTDGSNRTMCPIWMRLSSPAKRKTGRPRHITKWCIHFAYWLLPSNPLLTFMGLVACFPSVFSAFRVPYTPWCSIRKRNILGLWVLWLLLAACYWSAVGCLFCSFKSGWVRRLNSWAVKII